MDRNRVFCILIAVVAIVAFGSSAGVAQEKGKIVHDAEYYILYAQNGQKWDAEDRELDRKLAELRAKYGRPPNLIHIMWDDTAYGDVGIPAIQKVRGFETPHLNTMAEEGILFTHMYTEVGAVPPAGRRRPRDVLRSAAANPGIHRKKR